MTDQLRVAQVVCTDAFAGVERYVTTLASGLAELGCHVTVVGGQGTRMLDALEPAGVRWLSGPTRAKAWARLVQLGRVDVVHAHMTAAELAAVAAKPVLRAPVVATRHFAQTRGSSPAARLLGRALTRCLAEQLVISEFVAQAVEGTAVVVPPGTPEPAIVPDPGERERVVLVAQRLEAEKRTDQALRIWQRSGLGAEGWRLAIVGDGANRPALERQAQVLDITSSCTFFGSRADVDVFQKRAAIFLAPRADEPFGLSVVEAMAHGLPVVAAAGGGHLETVGSVPGAALYPPEDLASGAQLLRDLAEDADRRKTYAGRLQEAHNRLFSAGRQAAAVLAVYRRVCR